MENGTRLGFPGGAASAASDATDPASWVCLLQALSGRPMILQIGGKSFRLSSDTLYFLEEFGPDAPREDRRVPPSGRGSRESFIYVCGNLEALSRTLGDLRRAAPGKTFRAEGGQFLHGLGN